MIYDLAIIGAGPAGLSASVYASRYGIKNIVVGEVGGGLAMSTHEIGNWLGSQKVSGFEFAKNAIDHASSLGAEIRSLSVDQIEKKDGEFGILLSDGSEISAKTLLLSMGTKRRKLGVSGEKDFAGKGVSYCSTCDGFFYKDKIVAVVGGGDSAASAAVYLANIAKKVYLIYRGDKLRAERFWVDAMENNPNVEIIYNTNVKEIKGNEKVEKIELDMPINGVSEIVIDGLFVEIGLSPNTEMLKNMDIEMDDEGYIKIDSDGRTSVNGIWSAGDITNGSSKFRQIVTAASEGAIAANSINVYLNRQK
ncbi:MAG: FAD-dependent oxidoreductase [Candidatus Moranbacteria bacterium]|nr:FAD-dependent oxidoreductase [Candidatus Moranbacteria bacterium]